jgi:Fe2+ transport system protein B
MPENHPFQCFDGMNATVGNWPGVTIERKEGFHQRGQRP